MSFLPSTTGLIWLHADMPICLMLYTNKSGDVCIKYKYGTGQKMFWGDCVYRDILYKKFYVLMGFFAHGCKEG